jgi:chromosome partitioning protein
VPTTPALAGAEVELVNLPERERRLARALDGPLEYDFVLIDCPPSLGLLTVNALTAARYVIVPIQCEFLALEGVGQLINTIDLIKRRLNPPLDIVGVLMTMYDARTRLSAHVVEEVRRYFPQRIFQTVVPRSVRLAEAPSYGQSIAEYDAGSRGAHAYRDIAQELIARLEVAAPVAI